MQNTAESCPVAIGNILSIHQILLQRGRQSALWCMKKWFEFQRERYMPNVRGRFLNCSVTAVDCQGRLWSLCFLRFAKKHVR